MFIVSAFLVNHCKACGYVVQYICWHWKVKPSSLLLVHVAMVN